MIFADFSVISEPKSGDLLEILQRPFSIQILTAIKNLQKLNLIFQELTI